MKFCFRYILRNISPYILCSIFIIVLTGCEQSTVKRIWPFTKFKQTTLQRITDNYINYIEAISTPDFPLGSFQSDFDLIQRTNFITKIQKDSDLVYFPNSLWQIYSLNGKSKWEQYALNYQDLLSQRSSPETFRKLEAIQNLLLTPYEISGEQRYQVALLKSMELYMSGVGKKVLEDSASIHSKEIPIQKLLVNKVLFFASDETGDPVYKYIALKNTELIIEQHFADLQTIKSSDKYSELAIGLYGFAYLYNETGIENYKKLTQNIALVFMPSMHKAGEATINDFMHQSETKLDLITEALVCLGLYNMGIQDGNQYRDASAAIYNHILDSIDQVESINSNPLSFKLFYYLFEYERLKQKGQIALKSN